MPPPSPARATVTAWEPGRMTIALDPAPPQPSYVLVAENWYPDWRATVDGASARVIRGDYALITVPVPAGADRKSTRLNSSHSQISYAVFCLKKKTHLSAQAYSTMNFSTLLSLHCVRRTS